MRRVQAATVVAALVVIVSARIAPSAREGQASRPQLGLIESLAEPGEGLAITQVSPESGRATFAASRGQGVLLPGTSEDAADRASVFVDLYGRAFGLPDRTHVRLARAPARDALGVEHVRFQQVYQEVPVAGGQFLVHLKGHRVLAANGRVLERMPADMTPVVRPEAALAAAVAVIEREPAAVRASARYSEPRLEVFNRGFLEDKLTDSHLAWFVEARGAALREFIWIDAHLGTVLLNFSQLHAAKNRAVYDANGAGTLPGTLARAEGGPATGNADVDAAYDLSGVVYDYFLTTFGRDSYNGLGASLVSSVNYDDGVTCPNAFWNGSQMVYCAGFAAADDVDGHELTHAVTEHEATLFYFMQSGALNESFSDIFGETIDQLNVTGADTPGNRWLLGEDLAIGAVRNMMNPPAFAHPGKMSDLLFFACDPTTDGGGVHTNSGVPNHAYALMVDGGSYNGYNVAAIGLTKAAAIHYRALTVYLTNSSGFLDAFNAIDQSCSDLTGSNGITSSDCAQVTKALFAVEMNAAWGCIGADQQLVEPAFCPAGGTPTYLMQEGFEGGAPGWTMFSTTATMWDIQGFYVGSGAQSAYGPVPGLVSDHRLTSPGPGIVLPAGARLMFDHAHDLEMFLDGGVVEYSTNGGTAWNDGSPLIDGGLLASWFIDPCCGNPLGGRAAFSSGSFGFKKTRLNLATLAGQSVQFRWRIGSGDSGAARGWFVDDVRVYSCTVIAGAPQITQQPFPQAVLQGSTAILFVTATGDPLLKYQWFKNGSPVPGATTNTLTIPNVQWLDSGYYSVAVSNGLGTARSDGALLVVALDGSTPTFTKQPLNRTVTVGQAATFVADTLNQFADQYQWQRSTDGGATWNPVVNGAPYSGPLTRTLVIAPTTLVMNNEQFRLAATFNAVTSLSDPAILNVVPANFIANGDFSDGTTGWVLFETPAGNMESRVNGGVFEFNRIGDSSTQAVIFQNTGVNVAGTPLTAQFDLGNSSAVRKRVSVLMLDADFSDLSVCTFWLEPAAPLRTYRMRTHTNKPWANAAIYFYAASRGDSVMTGGFLQLDNVSMNFSGMVSTLKTECEDPTSPPPPGGPDGPNLIVNGGFGAPFGAPWGTFGQISGAVRDGVFEFIKLAGAPAGVVLQPTATPMTVGQFLTATLDLGNASPVRKRVTVLLHDSDFSDLSACTFWLPPGLPLSTYQMRLRATKAWTNATLSVYPATAGLDQWIRLDNVSLQGTPGLDINGTECLEPAEIVVPPSIAAPLRRTGK